MESIIKMLADHDYDNALRLSKKSFVELNVRVRDNYNSILDIERKRMYRIWEFSYKRAIEESKRELNELLKDHKWH